MVDLFLIISLICCWIVIFSILHANKKLKQKIDDHKELIKDLYRIDDERLLHPK